MRYAAVMRSFLRAAPAVGASNTAIGAWIRLYSHAAEIEAGGVIPGAAGHDDRRWLSTAMLTVAEVAEAVSAGLCEWRGADLAINGYDVEGEMKVRACRENGKNGGRPPRTKTKPNGKPNGNRMVSSSLTRTPTKTKPLSSPSPPSPLPALPLPTSALPDGETGGEILAPAGPASLAVYPSSFETFWSGIKTGTRPKGSKRKALEEWVKAGRPPAEILIATWAAYLESLGDGYSMDLSRWLRERGWLESWEPAPAGRRPTSRIDQRAAENQQMFDGGREWAAEGPGTE